MSGNLTQLSLPTAIVQPNGAPTAQGFYFFLSLMNRTGGASPSPVLIPIANNSALANISGGPAVATGVPFAQITGVGSALKWTNPRTLTYTGDVTGTLSLDGSADVSSALTIATGAVTTSKIANSAVTYAKIQNASAADVLLGRGDGAGAGVFQEITVGTGFTWSGTTLNSVGTGGTVTTTGSPASGNLTKFSGASSITNGDLSGDITTSGALATTLATVNSNVGTFGDSTHVAQVTVNAKGLVTAASNVAISGSGSGISWVPLSMGFEPLTFVSNGAGQPILVPFSE